MPAGDPADDSPTPVLRPFPVPPGAVPPRPPTAWSDVVLQLGQSLLTVGGALALAHWGKVSGEVAAAALTVGGAPALVRLAGRLRRPDTSPSDH
jgi:hypothetical protein